ncbi:hypothetical protein GCM10011376_19040 [Nocardioides flavus (ex Wang et al. 2016)]|uniref:Uncharacterized protein n=1 Tax=Nocardioides flavus (ex Wang et al. 2016) TaxID=2058780 RepID=A0ABQ3HMC9_9ACTN|nr:hypothetical protein GCM10011376_19040 [Nocardioides flavus (ex Wang et al. 2016)]
MSTWIPNVSGGQQRNASSRSRDPTIAPDQPLSVSTHPFAVVELPEPANRALVWALPARRSGSFGSNPPPAGEEVEPLKTGLPHRRRYLGANGSARSSSLPP